MSKKGYKQSEEHIKKRLKFQTDEFKNSLKERMILFNPFKNKQHTKESKLKMSKKLQGRISGMFGKKHTEEARKKMSERLKKNPPNYWLGKKMPLLMRIKMSNSKKGIIPWNKNKKGLQIGWNKNKKLLKISGINHWNWKGGISSQKGYHNIYAKRYKLRKRNIKGIYSFIEWKNLKEKYNYMCLCCKRFEPEIKLTVDHIIPISLGGNNDISNIQPLCISCNSKKGNRKIINYSKLYNFTSLK